MTDSHRDAVAALAERYGKAVFYAAYRVLGNAQDAQDTFQNVFLRLLDAGPLDTNIRDWQAYLAVAATRSATDLLRRRTRWFRVKALFQRGLSAGVRTDPRSEAAQQQEAALLRQSMAMLPKQESLVFALRHFEGLSYADIAGRLGITENLAGVRLNRAHKRLRKYLEPHLRQDNRSSANPAEKG